MSKYSCIQIGKMENSIAFPSLFVPVSAKYSNSRINSNSINTLTSKEWMWTGKGSPAFPGTSSYLDYHHKELHIEGEHHLSVNPSGKYPQKPPQRHSWYLFQINSYWGPRLIIIDPKFPFRDLDDQNIFQTTVEMYSDL